MVVLTYILIVKVIGGPTTLQLMVNWHAVNDIMWKRKSPNQTVVV